MKSPARSKPKRKSGAAYVGPRSFRRGEKMYGRDQEIFELTNRLLANHVVLLHALSGAGKTSMINAGLITNLETQGFRVLPVIRVKEEVDPAQMPAELTWNRYALSTLLSLEKDRPEKQRQPPHKLAGLSLAAYLKRRQPRSKEAAQSDPRTLLIFDQFEEILNLNPADIQDKKDFFAWLMPVLYDTGYWVLFSMRDDFVGGLEPYLGYVPNRLTARYRLEFLSDQAAHQAIILPARDWGVTFEPEAADELVSELRKVTVQDISGDREEQGPYIEPIQLQVVCLRLWENPRPDRARITLKDVKKSGSVDRALSDYYNKVLNEIARDDLRLQRNLRNWIERQLITQEGFRSQSMQRHLAQYGLNQDNIDRLVKAYLVRPEQRLNAIWYELAHDRLVRPVLQSNERWRADNLNTWQLAAERWERDGKHADSDLLLKRQALAEAQAGFNPSQSTQIDGEFLQASQKAIARAREIEIQGWADPERLRRVELGTNLDETGWGVIFHQDASSELKTALKELLDLRQAQAGAKRPVFFRVFDGPNGYRPGETAEQFLRRNGAISGQSNPEKVPYYLLIVGDPAAIPFDFQYGLDQRYAVGRIYFESLVEYQSYARSVSVCEGGTVRLPNRAVLFAPRFPGDKNSQHIADKFARPLASQLRKTLPNWHLETVTQEANKERLGSLLGGKDTPTLLLTVGLGAGAPYEPERLEDTGSVVCMDWSGPAGGTGKLTRSHYFSAEDVDLQAGRLLGQIAFLSNAYSAGIPARSDFDFSAPLSRSRLRPFLARLPQRLLGHPSGGALAVIAHIDRLWMRTYQQEDQDTSDIDLYLDLMSRLMGGYSVGAAVELLNQRYVRIAALLQERLQGVFFYQHKPDTDMLEAMMSRSLEARNFILLGDPAVRLPVDPDQPYQEPGPDWLRPEITKVVPLATGAAPLPTPPTVMEVEPQPQVESEVWYASGIDPATGAYAVEARTAAQIVMLLRASSLRSDLSQDFGSRRGSKY